jgi:K+-transporting ATPase KdpF subunit
MTFELIIGSVVMACLAAYLVYALIRPDKF